MFSISTNDFGNLHGVGNGEVKRDPYSSEPSFTLSETVTPIEATETSVLINMATSNSFSVEQRHNSRSTFVREFPHIARHAVTRPSRVTSSLLHHSTYLWELVNFGSHLVLRMRDLLWGQYVILGVLGPQMRSDLRYWLHHVEAKEEDLRQYWRKATSYMSIDETRTDEHWRYILADYQCVEPHFLETRDLVKMYIRHWLYAEWEWHADAVEKEASIVHRRDGTIPPPPILKGSSIFCRAPPVLSSTTPMRTLTTRMPASRAGWQASSHSWQTLAKKPSPRWWSSVMVSPPRSP